MPDSPLPGIDFSRPFSSPAAERVCSECGAPEATPVGDLALCERCYSEKGSCCPEFGKDDLRGGQADTPACVRKPADGGHVS